MQERLDSKACSYRFDSLSELAKYLDSTPRKWRYKDSVGMHPSASWDLNTGYDEAWELARYGWPEGATRAQKTLKAFVPEQPAPRDRVGFVGYMPHVPRFCAGAPDHMIETHRQATFGGGRILPLIIPVNATAAVKASHMANFGLGVAQYVRQLEMKGVRCEIWGAMCSEVTGKRVTHQWRIKQASQPLNLAVMAFSVGHPAMFRRIGFALRERSDARETPGYGQSVDVTLADLINPPHGAYILNGMKDAGTHAPTPAKAVEYITRQIDSALKAK